MFGRRLAVTTVKVDRNADDSSGSTMDFEKIGNTIVDTTSGVGTVVVVVASTLTALRVAEHIIKHVIK